MSKHTPGLWTNERGTIWGESVGGCQMELRRHRIADIRGWGHLQYLPNGTEIQDANARLIAKAPELYDILTAIMKHFRISKEEFNDLAWETPDKTLWQSAYTLIAEIDGEGKE